MQSPQGFDLKASSGETWHVGVTKVANDLFFSSGWGDFVKTHELQENDLLIFTFSGNSSFKVLIFDVTGCEKLSSLFAGAGMRKHFDGMVGQQVEQYDDYDDTSVPSQLIESHQNVSTLRKFSSRTKPRKELLPGSPNCSRSCDVKHEETAEEESDDDTYADFYYCHSRAANRLLDDEKHEIIGLASIQLGNPAFMTFLLRSHLQRKDNFLVIPSEFVDEHLHMRLHEVVLLRPNREERWHVSYYHQGSSSRGFRGQPWAKFVSDNKLHKGDICVFELINGARNEKKARTTMTVHVVRRNKSDGRFSLVG
ncbi:B3 domain-containing protein LOC_Os12g40090-like isoform X2 [Triticum dicoccoides]|uniref:B3 domain-containing protein LOC_Os12g40090-like isoform X2 n=1 Tax=Triticum dicoccoides TaxID=85692 RepID=UPI001891BFA9|nr:B3 domain-containing protein LOC_Os12g40090-like isoform X2 [Triticum dicoccoides]